MRSIHGTLFRYIALVWLLGLVIVTGAAYVVGKRSLEQFSRDDYQSLIASVAHHIETSFQEELQALDQVAGMSAFQPFDRPAARTTVAAFLGFDNIFSTIHVYEPDGTLAFAEKRPSVTAYQIEGNFHNKADADYVRRAEQVLATGKPLASPTYYTSSGELYQTYLVPIINDGKAVGLLSGGVFPDLSGLEKWIEGLKLGDDNFLEITDSSGRVVAHSGRPAHTYETYSATIPSLNFVVKLGASTARLEARLSEWLKILVIIFAVGVLVNLVITTWIGRRLSRPFAEIRAKLDALEQGDFRVRLATRARSDEIGVLSEKIQKISDRIETHQMLGEFWAGDDK